MEIEKYTNDFFGPADIFFEGLSSKIGLPSGKFYLDVIDQSTILDQIKMVFCLLISFPMGFFFNMIKNPNSRHIFGIVAGIFFEYLIFRNEIIHVFITIFLNYFISYIYRNNRKNCAIVTFIFTMGYLSCYHMYRMYIDYGGWKLDVSTILMVNATKHISFAWCFKDGAEPKDKLSKDQAYRRVEKLPSIMEYHSYILFYAGALVGPSYDYKEYYDFIHLRGEFEDIPSPLIGGLQTIFYALLNMGLNIFITPMFNQKIQADPEYLSKPVLYRIIHTMIAAFIVRTRYYCGWLLGTSNTIMSGFSYNGKDEKGRNKWDRIAGVKPLGYELPDNIKDRLEGWNYSTQVWLKRYVYLRICPEDQIRTNSKKATFASNVTFMVSAFWHGFYGVYYMAFFQLFLVQQISKSIYFWGDKFKFIPKPIAFALRWILTSFSVDYISAEFTLLEVKKAIIYLQSFYFIPTIIYIVLYVFFTMMGNPKKKTIKDTPGKKDQQRNQLRP